MQKFDIHLCLISDQATPNLTPILDPQFRPQEVLMLVSHQMQDKAKRLADVYRRYQVSSRLIPVADAYDLRKLEEQCLNIIADHEHQAIALNVTGGTKPMAIAAEHAFAGLGKPVFYIHPQDNTLFLLGGKSQPLQLANKLTLRDYLPVHGFDLVSSEDNLQQDSETAKLIDKLVNYATAYSNAIGRLNWLAQQAEDGRTLEVGDSTPDDANFDKLFDSIRDAGLASRKGNRIRFADEQAIRMLKGGWLEQHVFAVAQSLPKRQEAVFNLQVRSQSSGHSTNEIDVAILAQNRLHVVECKTSRMDSSDRRTDDLTYKLDSLSELGGLNTRTMLVSFQKVNQATLNRARDLRIKVVDAGNLRNLRQVMAEWIASK